jgi:hypothetical protein
MARLPVDGVGTVGINRDLPDHGLPPNVWSAGQNIRFKNDKASKTQGDLEVFLSPAVPPYWAMPIQTQATVFWLYAGLSKVYVVEGGTHTNITRIKTSPTFEPPARQLTISTTAPTAVVV